MQEKFNCIISRTLILCVFLSLFYSISAYAGGYFKQYTGSGLFTLWDIDKTHDGGFVMCGQDYDLTGGDFVILKVDSLGNEQWRYTNNDFNFQTGKGDNIGLKVKETLENEFVMIGRIEGTSIGNQQDIVIAKVDSVGNLIWKKIFDFQSYDEPCVLAIDEDSTFLIGETTELDNIFLKLDRQGDTIWSKKIPYGIQGFGPSIIKKVNEWYSVGFRVDSAQNANIVIAKVNTSGQIVWQKLYIDSLHYNSSTDIRLTADSTLLVFSNYLKNGLGFTVKIHEFDLNGNLLNTYSPQYDRSSMSGTIVNDTVGYIFKLGSINIDSIYIRNLIFTRNEGSIFKGYYLQDYVPIRMLVDSHQDMTVLLRYYISGGGPAFAALLLEKLNYIGVQEIRKILNVNVYPNPARDYITFELLTNKTNFDEKIDLNIYNSIGALVLSKKIIGKNKFNLPLKDLSSGYYHYFIKSNDNSVKYGKLIIN